MVSESEVLIWMISIYILEYWNYLEEKGISKTKICKALDLQRGNFNKYCRDDFKRIDANLIIKLCDYFNCEISDLLEIRSSNSNDIPPVRSKQGK